MLLGDGSCASIGFDKLPLITTISFIFRYGQPPQCPLAFELRTVKVKVQKPFVVISFNQLVSPDVPNHYCPTAILSLWNNPFKIQVRDRVVFSRHRQPFLVFLEWR